MEEKFAEGEEKVESKSEEAKYASIGDEVGSNSSHDEENIPPAQVVALRDGYNQTYIIRASENSLHEVLFRCGNWCYTGVVDLGGDEIGLADIPLVIPALQKQQGSLQYFCERSNVPKKSNYYVPLEKLYIMLDFIGAELSSEKISAALTKMADVFSWVDADTSTNYFELQTTGDDDFENIEIIASKTYVRELLMITIYYQKSFYIMLKDIDGEQPLLDVNFPDISQHLQGVQVKSFRNERVKKLMLWQAVPPSTEVVIPKVLKVQCKDVAGEGYNQTFLIRSPHSGGSGSKMREVLFRFGNWCYNGHMDLGNRLALSDIHVIIPMLRRQQNALTFMCETSKMPATSLFAQPMSHLATIIPAIRNEIASAEQLIQELVKHGVITSDKKGGDNWLEDDSMPCFFEFVSEPCDQFKDVEVIASKTYVNGLVFIIIYYDNCYYVKILDGSNEQPLLDASFPDVSGKNQGFQLKTYRSGITDCAELRKLSLWRERSEFNPQMQITDGMDEMKIAADAKSTRSVMDKRASEPLDDKEVASAKEIEAKANSPKSASSSPTKSRAALPHHIAPLKDGHDLKARLKQLGQGVGEAPWDPSGKPKLLGAKK